MISPTIGRVVWYYNGIKPTPSKRHPEAALQEVQPWPALICFVHSDTLVNLAAFGPNGNSVGLQMVPLIQEAKELTGIDPFCTWMPYQKQQAAQQLQKPQNVQQAVGA